MTRRLNVLIPMAGRGTRFREAGYDTYKPFVPILGKPMIQWVLDAFPPHVVKRVLADPTLLTGDQLAYLEAQPGVVVQFVGSHRLGPAYTIHQVRDELPLDESFFIAYCDIWWTWDFPSVESLLECDGVVFTRRQFHPHLIGNNYSAFCKPRPDDVHRLLEIREKGSFTDDWMQEPLSIGVFYVRDGEAMMRGISAIIDADRRVSAEFFPTLLFNELIAEGRDVRLSDVDFFVHWGVPSQLEDLRRWVSTTQRVTGGTRPSSAVNVCCMGGAGVRMQDVSALPKALLPIDGDEPMFRYVADRFGCARTLFVVNDALAPALEARGVGDDELVRIGAPTSSQLATLKRARGVLRAQSQFFLTSCDAFGLWAPEAFDAFVGRERPDAVVFAFEPTLLQERLGGGHTYVETEGSSVTAVHIKHRPHERARGLAGFFWFRDGAIFDELDEIPDDPGRELCADHILKYMVDTGRKVAAFPLEAYVHLGSPTELQEFAFWREYDRVFA